MMRQQNASSTAWGTSASCSNMIRSVPGLRTLAFRTEKQSGARIDYNETGQLETVDELTRRIEEAAHYIPIDQLALSPQCGFASELGGNLLSEEEQWRKLDIMLETAARIWGSS